MLKPDYKVAKDRTKVEIKYQNVDEKIKNPYTNEKVKRDEIVKASLDTTTAALTFEYPN